MAPTVLPVPPVDRAAKASTDVGVLAMRRRVVPVAISDRALRASDEVRAARRRLRLRSIDFSVLSLERALVHSSETLRSLSCETCEMGEVIKIRLQCASDRGEG